jgi:hypothetical protein
MPRANKILQSLNAGELSPLLDMRIDQSKYQSGCRTMENFYPLIHGGAERRPGTYFVAETKDSSVQSILVPFEYNVEQAYVLNFGNQHIRFFRNGGMIVGALLADTSVWTDATAYIAGDFVKDTNATPTTIYRCIISHTSDNAGGDNSGGDPTGDANTTQWATASLTSDSYPIYELPTPYLTADLFELKFEHSNDVMWITHPDYEPRKLSRTSTTDWKLEETAFDDGPFITQNTTTTALIRPEAPAWVTATEYKVDDAVSSGGSDYRCLVAHTSGTFATDLGAGYWVQDSKGSIRVGTSITLTASGTNADGTDFEPFVTGTTAGHSPSASTSSDVNVGTSQTAKSLTGALWKLSHTRQAYEVSENFTASGQTSEQIIVYKGTQWDYVTNGIWTGKMELERSYDDGTTWETIHTTSSEDNANSSVTDTEDDDDALYRMQSYAPAGGGAWSGTANCTFSVRDRLQEGVVEITAVGSATSATATVVSTIGGTSTTYRHAEGYWSNKNGWPACVTISPEERLTFAGSTLYPLTIWGTKAGDYTSMLAGSNDDDALVFTLIGRGQQNAIRWVTSKDVMLIGTAGGEHLLGATREEEALSPTNVQAKPQSSYGSANIEALVVNDAVLFVQRGGRKIREMKYSFEQDTYLADDLTIFSNHITESALTDWAYQRTPDPMLWCVRTDGQLAVMSYEKAQNVFSWCRVVTFTSTGSVESDFESVACISTSGEEDQVWVIVERIIGGATKRYIEYFSTRDF